MDPVNLIPDAEAIPAPQWLLSILEQLTFIIHILFINAVLGGGLIILFKRMTGGNESMTDSFHGVAAKKLPVLIALGINFGVAPLLFMQVTFGHLFYTSSVLMAVFWILVIPFLILAYYGAYIHVTKYEASPAFSKWSILISIILILYIGLMLVANNSMMEQPAGWNAYFDNRDGTILGLGDLKIWPRYLHFVAASVAVGGLFVAGIWHFKKNAEDEVKEKNIKSGLKIFAIATAVQFVIGFWYLLAQPTEIVVQFMGRNLMATIILFLGILMGIGAMVSGFLGKIIPSAIHLVLTIVFMAITRMMLRSMSLTDYFDMDSLVLTPQYGVLVLFLLIFVIGLATIAWMLKISFKNEKGGAAI